jgi:hypothetical protein
MLNLKKVVQRIDEKGAAKLVFWLNQRDAEKCSKLFLMLRDADHDERVIAEELGLRPASYYSLKSRLYSNIQEFLSINELDIEVDLLRSVYNIPRLLFDTPKELAIAQLLKMEKELKENDLPHALTIVYSALKKINRHSNKYFEYSQQYNKHMAYTMAIDKTQELLSDFNKALGEFLLSRDQRHYDLILLIKSEMYNYTQLYTSHRLTVYKNILDVEFALFLYPIYRDNKEQVVEVVEELTVIQRIITEYKNDANYSFLSPLVDFLWFEYYRQIKSVFNVKEYFMKVNERVSSILLYNFCCIPSLFLIAKAEQYIDKKQEHELYEESMALDAVYTPDKEDIPNYINYVKFKTLALYHRKKYYEVITELNSLIGDVSFRDFLYAEIEIKLFLATCYLMTAKLELADVIIRNTKRKLREQPKDTYTSARTFVKLLSIPIGTADKSNREKIQSLKNKFVATNKGKYKMLDFILFDKNMMKVLMR